MCAARYGAGVGSTTTVAEDDEPLRGRTNWGEDDALLFCEKGVCVEDGAGAGTAKGGLGCSTKGVKRRPEDSALTSSACDLERPPPSSAFPRRRLSLLLQRVRDAVTVLVLVGGGGSTTTMVLMDGGR